MKRIARIGALLIAAGWTPRVTADAPQPRVVWVMRHGEDGGPERRLTERGRKQVRQKAKAFKETEALTILTSPRIRCLETAGLVNELTPGSRLEVVAWLDYREPLPDDWRDRLPAGPLLLVTHQPVVKALLHDTQAPIPSIQHAFLGRILIDP